MFVIHHKKPHHAHKMNNRSKRQDKRMHKKRGRLWPLGTSITGIRQHIEAQNSAITEHALVNYFQYTPPRIQAQKNNGLPHDRPLHCIYKKFLFLLIGTIFALSALLALGIILALSAILTAGTTHTLTGTHHLRFLVLQIFLILLGR